MILVVKIFEARGLTGAQRLERLSRHILDLLVLVLYLPLHLLYIPWLLNRVSNAFSIVASGLFTLRILELDEVARQCSR